MPKKSAVDVTQDEFHTEPRTHITYVAPSVPKPTALEACSRLSREMPDLEFRRVATLQELFNLISSPDYWTNIVLVDVEECQHIEGMDFWEIMNSLATLARLQAKVHGKPPIIFVGGIRDTTPVELIKEAIRCQVFATLNPILGGSFTYEKCRDSVQQYSHNDYSIPTCITEILTPRRAKRTTKDIVLTPRQNQILELVSTRGASNKVIAKALKISESTVKLHMSAILKKYGCRNRTQLAVFSQKSRDQSKTPA